jgi:hypothetical protein
MAQSFMQRQVTRKQRWLRVETTQGTEFLPADLVGDIADCHDADDMPIWFNKIQQFTTGEPESWETIVGFGARLSAPGYLDCTEWTVFETEAEAEEYLRENYPEDDEDED